jgi:outer membrane protein assembly factor BamB
MPNSAAATRPRRRRYPVIVLLVLLLAGCAAPPTANPVLVTLPAAPQPTETPSPTSTVTTAPPTPTAAPSPTAPAPAAAITPTTPGGGEFGSIWQAPGTLRPVAAAASRDGVAVLGADGRFLWLAAATGEVTASTRFWPGAAGDTLGEVHTDGRLAAVAGVQREVPPGGGRVRTRARLAVYDASADELWSLPQLSTGHTYSALLLPGAVVAGVWPRGGRGVPLAAYDAITGQETWRATIAQGAAGVQPLLADESTLYALIDTAQGRGAASYDAATGEERWRWLPGDAAAPEALALDGGVLFALGHGRLWALDAATGEPRGSKQVASAPGAGLAAGAGNVVLVPAAGPEMGFRPGVLGLEVASGEVIWRAFEGQVVDALRAGEGAVWAVGRDFDTGQVALAALDLASGEAHTTAAVSTDAAAGYRLAVHGERVYVLGERLWAFGPRP